MWRCHDTSCQAAHIFSNYQQLCVWQSWIFKYIACCKISYRYEVRNGLSGRYQQQRCNVVTRGPKTVFHTTFFNPFLATGLFLCPLKTSENLQFSDTFRGYRKRPVTWMDWLPRPISCILGIYYLFMFVMSIYTFTDCTPMKTPPKLSGITFLKVWLDSLEENNII